eukprot:6197652-Pleurochrysis_carterae.AAC.1
MAQAGRRWQRSLFPWLLEFGFSQCKSDPCVFTPTETIDGTQQRLTLGCYVDNLFTLYTHDGKDSLYARFVDALLTQRWNLEDEGPVSDLLNVDITADESSVTLTQAKYIAHLVSTYLPDGVPLAFHKTRAPASETLPKLVEQALLTKPARSSDNALLSSYQSLVGALLYCSTQTRPDVALAVGMLCRAMSCPTDELYCAAQRVLYYSSHHRAVEVRFSRNNASVHGYSDSDWATRHSKSGYVFMYNQAAISGSSKKQPSVALSSCEAEIIAASEATKEAVYLRSLFADLGLPPKTPTSLSMDNKSAIDLAYNPEHHQRSKHIDRRDLFVRERVETHDIIVAFVASTNNLLYFFTKPLPPRVFFAMRDTIMNVAR